jgi:hypothetical protein
MSKTNRRRRAEKRRRPARRTARARQHTSAEPDLLADVRRALTDPNPLSLLSYVSTLLCVTDSRRNHPFARPDVPDLAALTREDLVATFLDVPAPETSALLAVIAEMAGDDDVLRARIRRELAARPKVEPAWLAQLSETSNYRAVRMSHVLGDWRQRHSRGAAARRTRAHLLGLHRPQPRHSGEGRLCRTRVDRDHGGQIPAGDRGP